MSIAKIGERGLLESFKYLDTNGLAAASAVCRAWKNAADQPQVWQQQFIRAFGETRAEAFKKDIQVKTWKDAVRYMPCLEFFDCIINLVSNPQNKLHFLQVGAYQFKIDKTGFNIEIVGVAILESGEKIPLVALQVDGPFAFALRTNGSIIQWNFKTKKIVQILQTFVTEIRDLRQFWVMNGSVYIREKNERQIIYYAESQKPSERESLEPDSFEILLKNGQLAYCEDNQLTMGNFEDASQHLPITSVTADRHHCYVYAQMRLLASNSANLTVIDSVGKFLKTIPWTMLNRELGKTPGNPCDFKIIFPFERLLLCYSENSIGIVDALSNQPIANYIEPVFVPGSKEFVKDLLNKTIKKIREMQPDPKPQNGLIKKFKKLIGK